MHMARFDMKLPPGSATHYPTINKFADQFQQRFSQFQSIDVIIDLVNMLRTVDPQDAWNQQVAKVEDISDVSSCS